MLGEEGREETRKAEGLTSLAHGSSVTRCTFASAILREAGSSVLAVTGEGTVWPPAPLWTHAIAVDTWREVKAQISFIESFPPFMDSHSSLQQNS